MQPKGGYTCTPLTPPGSATAEVCHGVTTEPHLQPLSGESLSHRSAITEDGARLDVAMYGFWGGRFEKAFIDVRVFNPSAQSNRPGPLSSVYRKHEQEKRRQYDQRVREVEHATFTPLVLSTTGGMGRAATTFYKRLSSMVAEKRNVPYAVTLNWIRCRLSFAAVQQAVQLLQIQEVHPVAHSSACNFCRFFCLFFLPVLSRPSFTFRTPNKDQKTEELFYFLLVQVL